MPKPVRHVFVCNNVRPADNPKGCCAAKGSEELFLKFREQVYQRFSPKEVKVTRAKCLGACAHGINMVVYPDNVWYAHVTEADLSEIIEQHLGLGKPVERLLLDDAAI